MYTYKGNSQNSGVYQLRNLANNKIYVGSSFRFGNRKSQHFKDLSKNIHDNSYLQNAWNKHNGAFIFEILELCETNKLIEREQYWLDLLQPFDEKGYNILKTAYNSTGFKHSEDSKRKISQMQIGKKVSKEIKDLLYSYSKGRIVSRETREKLRKINTGKKHTKETIEKLRLVNIGKKQTKESILKATERRYKKVTICNLVGEEIKCFKSHKECSVYLKITPGHVGFLLRHNKIYKDKFKFK